MSKIIIIGSEGFIGSHLVEFFEKKGNIARYGHCKKIEQIKKEAKRKMKPIERLDEAYEDTEEDKGKEDIEEDIKVNENK